ncbi:MAG: aminotransferase class V-fold PLP-dependent enzyme, partial [Candidatus Eisenbacteria bacterium]|nr:aminotransferase class V-fold PLP-dependent enzyme [Candidatus Latescibacterota bacterium]MBD3301861.1 aminotransferase class V-fold PLP-dependent enzyme [Candidatus Eisenbacteria bacterium]
TGAGAARIGAAPSRLPTTTCLHLPGVRGESLLLLLDRRGIRFSSGSACKSGDPEPSHVLLAMGRTPEEAHCAIRLSLGVGNTEEEIEIARAAFEESLKTGGETVRFVPCR